MNEKNLIVPTSSLARENGSKGGKASAAAKRRRKSMREKMRMLLDLPACENDKEQLASLGVPEDLLDNEMVILKGLFLRAADGDVAASKEIRSILGKDVQSEELALKKRELKLKEQNADTSLEVVAKLDEVLGGIKSEI